MLGIDRLGGTMKRLELTIVDPFDGKMLLKVRGIQVDRRLSARSYYSRWFKQIRDGIQRITPELGVRRASIRVKFL